LNFPKDSMIPTSAVETVKGICSHCGDAGNGEWWIEWN
jgi:hypothetical protein